MKVWSPDIPKISQEVHFDNRKFYCFEARPNDVYSMFSQSVKRNPDKEALIVGDYRLTWKELEDWVLRVASGLKILGIKSGDRIALLLSNGIEFVVTTFAASTLGIIIVPISTREKQPGIAFVLNQCGANTIVFDAALRDKLPDLHDIPKMKHQIVVGAISDINSFETLLNSTRLEMVEAINEEDVSAILYTSGTTGKPKGAILTHLNIIHSAMHYVHLMKLRDDDRLLGSVPFSHVTGLVALLMTMVRCGGCLIVMEHFKASTFLKIASDEKMTHTLMVPAMYSLCLIQDYLEVYNLTKWRVGVYGGAPMPASVIQSIAEKLPNLVLINAYGATETTSPATLVPPGETENYPTSIGKVVQCGEIIIMDENGNEKPIGESGEICIKGPMVAKGYWEDPAATAENFSNGYWHSGDIGSVDENGYYYIHDRSKDMINRGGYKIYSIEVENVIHLHPAVLEVAVIGRACPVLGERVHAVVYTVEGQQVSSSELAQLCAEQLADNKVPESFTFLKIPLPRNANGKILKRDLNNLLKVQEVK
ncbi:MAG: acyl--CoA ligase [Rhizobiales bacterium]|nr:acyl--CoA ligase [Hyphomicrobiales bacterium]